jgi:dUTP pyrophosphatase
MKLKIKKLTPKAKVPAGFAHEGDAGIDLFVAEAIEIKPMERVQVSTGIALAIPLGFVGLIWDKSGLSHKAGLKVMGGVIDAGYRGEIKVGIINLGNEIHTFSVGDKVTQMLVQKVEHPEIVEVEDLDETTRGEAGFGSTGV